MIINVFKPSGWTSNDVVQKIKHSCGYKKVGHAGTLDPLAEGVLIVLTDADTKRQSEFMGLKKEYVVKIAFGYESDSHDLGTPIRPSGKPIADKLTRDALQNALGKYIGKIQQQVPAYSAVHVGGQRLYHIVRADRHGLRPRDDVSDSPRDDVSDSPRDDVSGRSCDDHSSLGGTRDVPPSSLRGVAEAISLHLPYKEVEIYNINICSFVEKEQTAELRVSCGKGTYIRSLVRDLGKDLGCGAVATVLIRTKVGGYNIDDSLDLKGFFQNNGNQVAVLRVG